MFMKTTLIWSFCFTTVMECRTHTKTLALFSKLNLYNKVFQRTFCIMRNKFFQRFSSCTRGAHVEKRTKTTKFQMSNQLLGVNQLLRVTPNRWPTNFFFRFSSWASRVPLVSMMKKILFTHFWVFSIVFDHANACASMCLLVKIHNTCYHVPVIKGDFNPYSKVGACKKERKAGVASIVTLGQYNASNCAMLT